MAGREGRKIYSTHRWAWTRRAVLRAAGYRCAGCGRGAREVDHILAVARGGAAFELSKSSAAMPKVPPREEPGRDLGVQSDAMAAARKRTACEPRHWQGPTFLCAGGPPRGRPGSDSASESRVGNAVKLHHSIRNRR